MKTEPRVDKFDHVLRLISAVPLALIVVLTFVDVFARYLFASPVRGATEIIQFAMAMTIFAALPLVTRHGEHVSVDMFTHALNGRAVAMLRVFGELCSLMAFSLIAWRLAVQAGESSASGTATIVLGWGMAPLEWAMCAFSVVTACVVLLRLMSALGSLFGPSGDAA